MNVVLTAEVEKYVEEKVQSGQYASAEEAVNTLLVHVREQEQLTAADIEELRAEVDVGLAEADRGQFVAFTAEDIISERHASLAARKKVS